MNTTPELHKAIAAVAPISGVSVGKSDDKKTWAVRFKDEATKQQRDAAQAVIDGFVWDQSPAKDPLTIEDVATALLAKGVLTNADLEAAAGGVDVQK